MWEANKNIMMNGKIRPSQKKSEKETDWICVFFHNRASAGVTAYSAVWIL